MRRCALRRSRGTVPAIRTAFRRVCRWFRASNFGASRVNETSTRARVSTAVKPPEQPEVRRQDLGCSTFRFSHTSTLSPCSHRRTSATSSMCSMMPSLYKNPTAIASRFTGVHMKVSHTSPLTVNETGVSTMVLGVEARPFFEFVSFVVDRFLRGDHSGSKFPCHREHEILREIPN